MIRLMMTNRNPAWMMRIPWGWTSSMMASSMWWRWMASMFRMMPTFRMIRRIPPVRGPGRPSSPRPAGHGVYADASARGAYRRGSSFLFSYVQYRRVHPVDKSLI